MIDLIQDLREKHPLLAVPNPSDEIASIDDWTPVKVPDGMFPLITEFIVRYAFVCAETEKGEIGRQLQHNSGECNLLRCKIQSLGFEGRFTMPFYGYIALITIDYSRPHLSERIEFSFINHIGPADQEADAS